MLNQSIELRVQKYKSDPFPKQQKHSVIKLI